MHHPIYIIAAMDQKRGIGKNGQLPWHLSKDLQFFQRTTETTEDPSKTNVVVMGRRTWESIPSKHRPLSGRHNVVLSRHCDALFLEGVACFQSLDEALKSVTESVEQIFVIGGGQVFKEALSRPDIQGIYLTQVQGDFDCDTFFPSLPSHFVLSQRLGHAQEKGIDYDFLFYSRLPNTD